MLRADNRSDKTTQIQLSQVFSVPRNLLTYKLFLKNTIIIIVHSNNEGYFFQIF